MTKKTRGPLRSIIIFKSIVECRPPSERAEWPWREGVVARVNNPRDNVEICRLKQLPPAIKLWIFFRERQRRAQKPPPFTATRPALKGADTRQLIWSCNNMIMLLKGPRVFFFISDLSLVFHIYSFDFGFRISRKYILILKIYVSWRIKYFLLHCIFLCSLRGPRFCAGVIKQGI